MRAIFPAALCLFALLTPAAQAQTPQADSLATRLPSTEGRERIELLADLAEHLRNRAPAQALTYGHEALALLETAPNDTLQIRVLYQIASAHRFSNAFDSTHVYVDRLKPLAQQTNSIQAHAQGLRLQGIAFAQQGQSAQALTAFQGALALWERLGDEANISNELGNIGIIYRRTGRLEEALATYQEALAMQEALGVSTINTRMNLAIIYSQTDRYEDALDLYAALLPELEASNNLRGLANLLSNQGNVLKRVGRLDNAIAAHQRAYALQDSLGNVSGQGSAMNNLGLVYHTRGAYDQALEAFLIALDHYQTAGNERGLGSALDNVAMVYNNLGQYEQALDYHQQALDIRQRIQDRRGQGTSHSNIGLAYQRMGDFDAAILATQQALALYEEVSFRSGQATALLNLGTIYHDMGAYEQEIAYTQQALAIHQSTGFARGIAATQIALARAHLSLDERVEASLLINDAIALADSLAAFDLQERAYLVRAELGEDQGQFADALADYKAHKAASDSLFNTDRQAIISELQTRFQTQQQAQRIQILEQAQEIQALWRNLLVGGVVFLGLIAALAYSRYRLKHRAHRQLTEAHEALKRTQNQLVQAEKMASLGRLTAGIAHEIKNPLNFVNNFSQLSGELLDDLEEELEALASAQNGEHDAFQEIIADLRFNQKAINNHGKRADNIVVGMLDHAQHGPSERRVVPIRPLLDEYAELAKAASALRHPDLDVRLEQQYAEDLGSVEVSPQDLGRALLNLLNNAFDALYEKATQADATFAPHLTLHASRAHETLTIRVSDNGTGIADTHRKDIFEPFFTTKPTGHGNTGLGLSLTYDIITQGHNGTVTVDSEAGQGTTFTIAIPV